MGNEVVQFINHWLYDADRFLRNRLESLKDDLTSDDSELQSQAAKEADEILDWLLPPMPALTAIEKVDKASWIRQQENISEEDKEIAIARVLSSTGRRRGRPRDTSSQFAIRALGLHLALGMSWREIAFRLKGCSHERPLPPHQRPRRRNPNISCEACGEAMRIAVFRLKDCLSSLGFQSSESIMKHLDNESRLELLKLWNIEPPELPRT